jgi:hypothetical protein
MLIDQAITFNGVTVLTVGNFDGMLDISVASLSSHSLSVVNLKRKKFRKREWFF